jgi:hypothetical protein
MSWQVHYLFFSKIGIALFNVIRFICRIIYFFNLLSHDTIHLGFFRWNSVVISSILVKEQVWYSLVIITLVRLFGIETKLVKQLASAFLRSWKGTNFNGVRLEISSIRLHCSTYSLPPADDHIYLSAELFLFYRHYQQFVSYFILSDLMASKDLTR